jgi:hypothetical protein
MVRVGADGLEEAGPVHRVVPGHGEGGEGAVGSLGDELALGCVAG